MITISFTEYAASGTAFSSYDDLQFVTPPDDRIWNYSIIVNDGENVRPPETGRTLTISGYELAYEDRDNVHRPFPRKGTA